MIREVARGHDGWYFENKLIEATPEEIEAWEDRRCHYCGSGSLFDKRLKSLEEQCNLQVPCPICEGSGLKPRKDVARYSCVKDARVISVGSLSLDKDTLCPMKKITIEIDYRCEVQQDGRPSKDLWRLFGRIYWFGKVIVKAISEWNSQQQDKTI